MKKVIVLLVLSALTMSASVSSKNPELSKEIERKIVVDLSDVELDEYSPDFVIVSFRIVANEIKILEINGTSKVLKERIIQELYDIKVESDHSEHQTYHYKFTFQKK